MWIVIFKAEWSDRRHLRDVFAGLRPMEMPGFARKNDDASRRIGLHLVTIEGLPEPDVKNARHDRVDTILWMLVRHQFRAVRHLDSDHVRTGLGGMANQDRQTSRGRERREWLPVDIFRQDHSEIGLVRLMIPGHATSSRCSMVCGHSISLASNVNRPCFTDHAQTLNWRRALQLDQHD